MSISVIVPTIGRDTLVNTIMSILPQLTNEDELIISADGLRGLDDVKALHHRIRYIESSDTGRYGNKARDRAMFVAKGTHLAFCDDDDIMTRTALSSMRRAIYGDPECLWLFRMIYGEKCPPGASHGQILWKERKVELCNVGTPMLLMPRVIPWGHRGIEPKWADGGDGPDDYSDFFFIDKLVREWYTSSVRFDSDIVCIVRPGAGELKEELNVV